MALCMGEIVWERERDCGRGKAAANIYVYRPGWEIMKIAHQDFYKNSIMVELLFHAL